MQALDRVADLVASCRVVIQSGSIEHLHCLADDRVQEIFLDKLIDQNDVRGIGTTATEAETCGD